MFVAILDDVRRQRFADARELHQLHPIGAIQFERVVWIVPCSSVVGRVVQRLEA